MCSFNDMLILFLPTQAVGYKASHLDVTPSAESQRVRRVSKAMSRAAPRVVTPTTNQQPSNVLKPMIVVRGWRCVRNTIRTVVMRICCIRCSFLLCNFRTLFSPLLPLLVLPNSVLHPHNPNRQLGARRAIRMRHQLRSRRRVVGRTGQRDVHHFELRPGHQT